MAFFILSGGINENLAYFSLEYSRKMQCSIPIFMKFLLPKRSFSLRKQEPFKEADAAYHREARKAEW
jgi:hypothetical protein